MSQFTDNQTAKHDAFEQEKFQAKLDAQKLRDSIRPLKKGEKPKADEYELPAACANCKYEGSMAIKNGQDVSGAHKIIHAKICPACGCEAFAFPDPLAKRSTVAALAQAKFHVDKAQAHKDIYKITQDPDDRRKARAHLAAADVLIDIIGHR